jgi:hypothetical protein
MTGEVSLSDGGWLRPRQPGVVAAWWLDGGTLPALLVEHRADRQDSDAAAHSLLPPQTQRTNQTHD